MNNKSTVLMLAIALPLLVFAKGNGSGHASTASSGGSHSISGHVTKNGTYVAPSHATNPNNTKADNWSTKGNVNPYTGKEGTKNE